MWKQGFETEMGGVGGVPARRWRAVFVVTLWKSRARTESMFVYVPNAGAEHVEIRASECVCVCVCVEDSIHREDCKTQQPQLVEHIPPFAPDHSRDSS